MTQRLQHPATASSAEPLVPPWCSHLARVVLILALVATSHLLPPAATDAADGDPREAANTQEVERGKTLFRIHCANCHGETARGDGPMVEVLRKPVPNLTLLARHHDGEFPAEHVRQSIDGRFAVPGHGRREMPVWGLSFQDRGRSANQEREVQERLSALVEYLRSIQREDG